eukprot:8077551-Alexandrium_andersonii.AAC.1
MRAGCGWDRSKAKLASAAGGSGSGSSSLRRSAQQRRQSAKTGAALPHKHLPASARSPTSQRARC